MNKMYSRYRKEGLLIVGLSIDRELELARGFVEAAGTKYPTFLADDSVIEAYELKYVPYHVYIDRKGQVVEREVGFHEDKKAEIEERIVKLLKEGG